MTDVFLISETYIKENTTIGQNVDIKDIRTNILIAQDIYLQDILGTNLYEYILSGYTNEILTDDEILLVEKIKPAVAYRAAENSLPNLNYQIKNKGVQTQFSDYSQSVDIEVLRMLRNEMKNKAEFYETRLQKFLTNNSSKYTLYHNNTDVDIKPSKNDNEYDCGLVFF